MTKAKRYRTLLDVIESVHPMEQAVELRLMRGLPVLIQPTNFKFIKGDRVGIGSAGVTVQRPGKNGMVPVVGRFKRWEPRMKTA